MTAEVLGLAAKTRQATRAIRHIIMCAACAVELNVKWRKLLTDTANLAVTVTLRAQGAQVHDPVVLLMVGSTALDIALQTILIVQVAREAIHHGLETWRKPDQKA